jgi:hypothetical protein
MTLATVLCVSILYGATATPPPAAVSRALPTRASQTSSADKTTSAAQTQDQATPEGQSQAPPSTPPDTKTPSTQNGPSAPVVRHRAHKKKPLSLNCNPAAPVPVSTTAGPGTSGSPASDSAPPSASAADTPPSAALSGNTPAITAAGNAPVNCPPKKVIVPNGGVPDPTVQLAGGSGPDKASQDSANQMLTTTEQNLKKLEGRNLSPNERDVVTQIRGFMDQSKKAAASGDASRARTLAWKAQLLSEDLLKPKQ